MRGGARFVDDAAPFERMKLRMVNGSHSALAYLGLLAGLETVDRAIGDAGAAPLIDRADAHEIAPTLPAAAGLDLDALAGAAARALRESGAAAPHAPDREGRLAETAAARCSTRMRDRPRPSRSPAEPSRSRLDPSARARMRRGRLREPGGLRVRRCAAGGAGSERAHYRWLRTGRRVREARGSLRARELAADARRWSALNARSASRGADGARSAYSTAFTMSSTTFFASPNTIIVLSM